MDLPEVKELEKLVKFCRKSGIKSLKNGEFSIELDSAALFPESNYKKKQDQSADSISPTPLYTEEEALYWSSAGIPEEQGTN